MLSFLNGARSQSFGLLLLRLGAGGLMAVGHGYGKLTRIDKLIETFSDPIGIGSAASAILATGAEFFGALLLMIGLATRPAAAALALTMLVAAFIQHGDDPFKRKELALLFAVPFITLIFTGPGRFSVDQLIKRHRDG